VRSAVVAALVLAFLPAPEAQEPAARGPVSADFNGRARDAVERGLAFLAARQNPNGSWYDRVGYSFQGVLYGEDAESVYGTALACMAFVAAGNVPGRGRYGGQVARGLQWLLARVREDGYVTHAGSRMYDHAIATLFLADMVGMTRREDVKRAVKRAVYLLVNAQNPEGGWRHQPIPVDADLSVSALVIQALRAARNAGVAVPESTVLQARRYVTRCATEEGFVYQPPRGWGRRGPRTTFAMTAGGIVSMFNLGVHDAPEVRPALEALSRRLRWDRPGRNHYFYAHYFASQAAHAAGGEVWASYYPRVRDEILEMQQPDGRWEDEVGIHYATSMACIVLQAPCERLSLFQK